MSENLLESVLGVLYSSQGGPRFNTNLCPRALKYATTGQGHRRSRKDAVSESRSKCISSRSTKSMSRSSSRSQTCDTSESEMLSSIYHVERTVPRSRDSRSSRSQRSRSEFRSEGSRSSSLSRINDRRRIDPETQMILDKLPLPEKYLQQTHLPTSQHGDVSTKVVQREADEETDSGFSSVIIADRSSSYCRDGSNLDELFKGGRSSRGDTIPTAHVSPHQTSHTSSYRHHQPVRAAHTTAPPAAAPLRRTVSNNDFADLYFRSTSPPPNDGYLIHKAAYGATVGARRWKSYHNLQEEPQQQEGELSGLLQDVSRLQLAESGRLMKGLVNTGCDSSRTCSQSHLNLTGCDGSQGTALRTASSVQQHVGYTPAAAAANHLYLHHVGTGGSTQDLKACMSAPLSPYNSEHMPHTKCADKSSSGSQYRVGFMTPVQPTVAGSAGGYEPQVGAVNGHCRHDAWTHANSSDITTWQQQHEEQLRRQHLDATKGLTNGTTSSAGLTSLLDPHKLDAVKRAADSIIREKDNIIDKQKLKICDLERQNQESESDKHKAMLHQAREENDALHFKLQEVEYECASLKAKLTEVTSSNCVADMERHLRKSEHELKELRASSKNDRQSRLVEQKSIQDMLAAKDASLSEWQEKYAAQTARLEALQRMVDGSTDLSTTDPKRLSEVRQLREDKARYKARSLELERRLETAKKTYRQRQDQVQHLEESNSLLQQQVKQLETETAELRTDLGLGEDGEHALFVLREEVEDLRHDNRRLHADLDKARKLLDVKHKKQQALETQHQGDTRTLEDRLTQEEGTVTELRQELSNKEQQLKKLRASLKELGSKNQDLSEKNSSLLEAQKELEKQLTGEAHKLEQRLLREMAVCFTELQSLVQICVQRAEGKEPNISVLLGGKGIMNLDPDDMQPVGGNVQSLKYKVTKIHELRQDIDNLRELISNKYAEDMGESLECTTQ